MLQVENFIYFFTVCGFFIGLIFSVLNFATPFDIVLYTCFITLFFYLFIHVAVINFMDFSAISKKFFNKKEHEDVSEYFIKELDQRENRMEGLLLDIKKLNQEYNNLKKSNQSNNIGKNEREYKKAA